MRKTIMMITFQKNRIITKHKKVQKDLQKKATRKKQCRKRARRKKLLQKNNRVNRR